MPLMNTIIRYVTYPFTRVVELTRPKKEAPKGESKKEDPKKKEDKGIDEAAIKKLLEAQRDEVIVNASGLEVVLRGHDYKVRLTKPAHGAQLAELSNALKRNRDLLDKSTDDLYRLHCGNIDKNKEHNQMIEAIAKGLIKPENDKMKAAFAGLLEQGKVPLDTWNENFLRPGIQNALVARANIDLLIPLINMRGGDAEYKGLEAHPIDNHINGLRDNAAKQATALIPPPEPPKTDEWTIQEFLIAAVVVIIITLLLRAFI